MHPPFSVFSIITILFSSCVKIFIQIGKKMQENMQKKQ